MTLQYVRLTDETLPVFSFVRELYEGAFPLQERRDWSSLVSLLKYPDMQLDLILDGQQPIGFIIWWKLQDWLFIEHFAISTKVRNAGYGAQVMRHYLEMAGDKILLEVEPPLTTAAQRRIGFYEKLGLSVIDIPYEQPSYVEDDKCYPMFLMSTLTAEKQAVQEVIDTLKEKVYHKKKLTDQASF